MCIGKQAGMYFTDEMAAMPCKGDRITLPKFWAHTSNGNLDAEICAMHAGLFVAKYPDSRKFYLTRRVQMAQREVAARG